MANVIFTYREKRLLMRKVLHIIIFGLIGLNAYAQTAEEIISKAEDKMRGESSYAEMKITTVRPKWSREMTLKSWSKGEKLSLIYIASPAREKGTVFLKKGKEVWNWIPSIERTIKLPPSMMSQSWMGTDMTNDDLVKESEKDNDFTHKLIGEEVIDGLKCWKIELIPKEDAAIVWGKILSWIDQKEYNTMKSEFYDEDGYLVNLMKASNVKEMGGIIIPTRMEIIPVEEKGKKTILEYVSLKLNLGLQESYFTLQNMKKIK